MASQNVDAASASSSEGWESVSNIDEERLYQLATVSTIVPIFKDVLPVQEPEVKLHPVAKIKYSKEFSFIYGIYRSLRSTVYHSHAPSTTAVAATAAPILSLSSSPARWFLLLAFALRQCTAHYTVWMDRRDIIMSTTLLLEATREKLPNVQTVSSLSTTGVSVTDAVTDAMARMQGQQAQLDVVSASWLPSGADLTWQTATSAALPTRASPWRAVRWELHATAAFAHLYHKNFQVWHHRKELLQYALQWTAANEDVASLDAGLLTDQALLSKYLQQQHGMSFHDIDERQVTQYVLYCVDGKNYHAWLHRISFLRLFPFLLTPPSWKDIRAFAATVSSDYIEQLCRDGIDRNEPQLPPSPLTAELDMTAELIQVDSLNNSAWCHRYRIFRDDLVGHYLRDFGVALFTAATTTPSVLSSTISEFLAVIAAVCRWELHVALHWSDVDPTNEASYTHARSIALLYHTIATRVRLAEVLLASSPTRSGEVEERMQQLFHSPLCSPVSTTRVNRGIHEGPTPDSVAQLYADKLSSVSWSHYRESWELAFYLLQSLRHAISPKARRIAKQFCNLCDLPEEDHQRRKGMAAFYASGTQFLLDNLHQVEAAIYHNCQSILEEMWVLYLTANLRNAIRAARPSEDYSSGIPRGMLQATDDILVKVCHNASQVSNDNGCVTAIEVFLAMEATALVQVKQLTAKDRIRLKYWKHEALVVIFRRHNLGE